MQMEYNGETIEPQTREFTLTDADPEALALLFGDEKFVSRDADEVDPIRPEAFFLPDRYEHHYQITAVPVPHAKWWRRVWLKLRHKPLPMPPGTVQVVLDLQDENGPQRIVIPAARIEEVE